MAQVRRKGFTHCVKLFNLFLYGSVQLKNGIEESAAEKSVPEQNGAHQADDAKAKHVSQILED